MANEQKERLHRSILRLVPIACAIAFTAPQEPAPMAAQSTRIIGGGRPVASAVVRVAHELGWNITYEDPPYVNADELRDITVNAIGGRRLIVPRGGRVLLPENLEALAVAQDPVTLLESIVATEQTATGTVRRFKILRAGSRFQVVPTKFLDAERQWRKVTPVLDTHVLLSHGEVNLLEFMDLLCDAITGVGGISVKAGRVPANLALRTKLPPQRREGPAREFLLETIESLPQPWSWLLFYDPSRQTYYLHIVPPGTM